MSIRPTPNRFLPARYIIYTTAMYDSEQNELRSRLTPRAPEIADFEIKDYTQRAERWGKKLRQGTNKMGSSHK